MIAIEKKSQNIKDIKISRTIKSTRYLIKNILYTLDGINKKEKGEEQI